MELCLSDAHAGTLAGHRVLVVKDELWSHWIRFNKAAAAVTARKWHQRPKIRVPSREPAKLKFTYAAGGRTARSRRSFVASNKKTRSAKGSLLAGAQRHGQG